MASDIGLPEDLNTDDAYIQGIHDGERVLLNKIGKEHRPLAGYLPQIESGWISCSCGWTENKFLDEPWIEHIKKEIE